MFKSYNELDGESNRRNRMEPKIDIKTSQNESHYKCQPARVSLQIASI